MFFGTEYFIVFGEEGLVDQGLPTHGAHEAIISSVPEVVVMGEAGLVQSNAVTTCLRERGKGRREGGGEKRGRGEGRREGRERGRGGGKEGRGGGEEGRGGGEEVRGGLHSC